MLTIVGDTSDDLPVDLASWAEPEARDRFIDAVTMAGSIRERGTKVALPGGGFRELVISADLVTYRGEPCVFAVGRDITDRGRSDSVDSRLAAIVGSSQDAISAQDLDGRIIDWNEAAERLYGWSSDEALGRPVRMIVPPERIEELRELKRTVTSGSTVGPVQTVRMRRDGAKVDVSLTLTPITDASGRVLAVSSIAHDVSARLEAQRGLGRREEAYKTLVETSILGHAQDVLEACGRFG